MMFATAQRFMTGSGFTKDETKAAHFYKMAAAEGHTGAREVLDGQAKRTFRLETPWGCSWSHQE